jgi:hypothetical protein
LLKKFNTPSEFYKAWFNQQLDIGLDQAANGELIAGNEAFERMQMLCSYI